MISDEEIEEAKREILENRRIDWAIANRKFKRVVINNQYTDVPDVSQAPPAEEFEPRAWLVVRWGTGYIVTDADEFNRLSKRKQSKILNLGGKNNVRKINA